MNTEDFDILLEGLKSMPDKWQPYWVAIPGLAG